MISTDSFFHSLLYTKNEDEYVKYIDEKQGFHGSHINGFHFRTRRLCDPTNPY